MVRATALPFLNHSILVKVAEVCHAFALQQTCCATLQGVEDRLDQCHPKTLIMHHKKINIKSGASKMYILLLKLFLTHLDRIKVRLDQAIGILLDFSQLFGHDSDQFWGG